MRMGRVIGCVTLTQKLPDLKAGQYLLVEALDVTALEGLARGAGRKTAMPESLVVFDQLGAGRGQIIAISEGAEAAMPFWPTKVPIDAYCAAILDSVQMIS